MAEIPQNSFQGPLAPKFGLTDNARASFQHEKVIGNTKRNYSGLIPVVGIAVAILVLPLTVQQLNQRQDTRQRASGIEPTKVVPTQTTSKPSITPKPTRYPTPTSQQPKPTLKSEKFQL